MAQTKKIDQERWQEFLGMISNGNRGRMVAIEVAEKAAGDQTLTDASPLFGIDYDTVDKGDDLVITTGREDVDFSHKINAPVEIWESQDDNGKVVALEITNREGAKTILSLKS